MQMKSKQSQNFNLVVFYKQEFVLVYQLNQNFIEDGANIYCFIIYIYINNLKKSKSITDSFCFQKQTMQNQKAVKKIGDFMIGKTIGQGTFGKVKSGIHMPSGHQVAIKILQKNKIKIKDDLTRVHNQLSILYNKVDHPNIIKLLQLHESVSNIYIVTQYIEGKQLYEFIVEKGNLDLKQCGIYFCQLVDAVSYLHSIGICHRDIKPQNIIVNGDNLKLIDFGLSREFKQNPLLSTSCGSPCYAAPQMLKGIRYDCIKSDIWAMGVTLYAMAAGHLPFQDENTQRLYQLINVGNFQPIKQMSPQKASLNQKMSQLNKLANINSRSMSYNSQQFAKPIVPHKNLSNIQQTSCQYLLSAQVRLLLINDLLTNILQTNPKKRISLAQINKNTWIKQSRTALSKIQTQFEDDEILLHSMSKYFRKNVNQLRQILKTKQIMSICTYYYLNRKKKIYPKSYLRKRELSANVKMKSQQNGNSIQKVKSKSKNKQKQHTFNSPKKTTVNFNPQSNSKHSNQNEPKILNYLSPGKKKMQFNYNTNGHSAQQNKNKSLKICQGAVKQSLIINKQILRQINNINLEPVVSLAGPSKQIQYQQQNPQVHFGGFHMNYVFTTLQQVYDYIYKQLIKKQNKKSTQCKAKMNGQLDKSIYDNQQNQIEQQSQQQSEQQQQEQYVVLQNYQQQKQQSEQQQYIMYNNKYVINNAKTKQNNHYKYSDKITQIYNSSIKQYEKSTTIKTQKNKQHKQHKQVQEKCKFLSKYAIQYKGIVINIKLLANIGMFYLDLPPYFLNV